MLSASKILLKRSSTEGAVPTSGNLAFGELALNLADSKIFFKNTNENIVHFEDSSKHPYTFDESVSSINTKVGSNTVTGVFAAVYNGYNNNVSGFGSSIVNGENNTIEGDFALIGNGFNNFIGSTADCGAILAGQNNQLLHQESFIIGSNITTHLSGVTYVNSLSATGKIYGDGSNLTGIVAGDTEATTLVRAKSATWDSSYTLIQSNSASWDYQGTDLKNLSSDWQSTYTTVNNLSSSWGINNVDGGHSTTIYAPNQKTNGGSANTF